MHYAVCSIVCAVSLCLCPTLSQYLFSLITMGACCGCLDGFFGRLLFHSEAFVFRHWLSVFFFLFCLCASVFVHVCIYAHVRVRRQRRRWVGTGRCAHFSFFTHGNVSPTFMFLLLSGLITAVFREATGYRMAGVCVQMLRVRTHFLTVHWHTYTDHINSQIRVYIPQMHLVR